MCDSDPTCRLLPFAVHDGALNMAIDEALLLSCLAGGPALTLRLYGWARPTLSLGYFQESPANDPVEAGLPTVRRLTGGGAIIHDAELTYSLVWRHSPSPSQGEGRGEGGTAASAEAVPLTPTLSPRGRGGSGLPSPSQGEGRDEGVDSEAALGCEIDIPRDVAASYAHINTALAAGLQRLGLEPGPPVTGGRPRDFLCFERRSRHDLVVDGNKVVGSAQRRRRGAVLQHGSILVGPSAVRGIRERSISELTGRAVSLEEAAQAVVEAFEEHLGWRLVPDRLSIDEGHLAEGLRHHKYNHLSWGGRRRTRPT